MTIGIIVAMDKELQRVIALLSGVRRRASAAAPFPVFSGTAPGNIRINVAQCGIGKVNAALAATEMIRLCRPAFLVSTGVAGGAAPDVAPLQTVAGSAVTYHDVYCGNGCPIGQVQGMPAIYPADGRLLAAAAGIEGVHTGLIATGDWFVDTREKALAIRTLCPGVLAIDMESCAIAQVCYALACPFISFRIISDNPLSDGGREQYGGFWERLADNSFRSLAAFLQNCPSF